MAKPSIANIVVTQTFQNWFDKTNELTGIIRSEAMTASAGGDTTIGNATLVGNFNASLITANVATDFIESDTNGGSVTFGSPTIHNALSNGICATFLFPSAGGKTRYTDGVISWDIGMEDTINAEFIIDTGTGERKFSISPSGTVSTFNIVLEENITGNNATFDNDVTCDDLFANNITFSGSLSGVAGLSFDDDITINGNLTVTGDGLFAGDVATNWNISDIRLKENLELIDNALDKVKSIGGYTFNYIDRPYERVAGVVAQEVEEVLPNITFEINEEGHKAVRYDNIIPLLIQAIKELSEKVDRLENGEKIYSDDVNHLDEF
jgi:hypothetical protein